MSQPIPEAAELRREEWRLSLLMATTYAVMGVHLPFFTVWLQSKGLDPGEIAAIMAAQPALKVVSMLAASRFGDRRGTHGPTLVAFGGASALAYALLGATQGFAWVLGVVALLALAQGPANSLTDGIIFAAARRRRDLRLPSLHFSFIRGWGSVAILVFMVLGGPAAQLLRSDRLVFLLSAVAGAAALVAYLCLRGLPDGAIPKKAPSPAPLERPYLVGLLILSASLIQSSHAFMLTFASLRWTALGHDENFVALAWAAALLAEVAFFLGANRWFGGEKRAVSFLIGGGVVAIWRWLWMASGPQGYDIFAVQLLHSVSCAAIQLGPAYLLAELAGKERVAQAQAWLAAMTALLLSIASYGSGPLFEAYGERGYLGMAGMAAVGLALAGVVALRLRGREPAIPESLAA